MHWKKWLLFAEIMTLLIPTLPGCSEPDTTGQPAVAFWLDGDPVMLPDFKDRVAISLKNWGLEEEVTEQDIQRAIDTSIRDLKVEKIIRREAERLGLKPIDKPEEVPKELTGRYGEGFETLEESETEWWNRVVSGFQIMDLAGGISEHLARDIVITEEMIQQDYEARKDYFTKPESFEFQIIRVHDLDLANDLHARLKKRWKFETLAQEHSNLNGEGAHGESVIKQSGELPGEFEADLQQLNPGEFSRVLASSEGYFIYKLIKKIPAEVLPLESVQDRLREDLAIRLRSAMFQEWLDREIAGLEYTPGTPLAVSGDVME